MPLGLTAEHQAINWADPLADGLLAFVIYPSGTHPVDLVGIGALTFAGSLTETSVPGSYGPAVDRASGSQGWGITGLLDRPSTANGGSILWIRRRYGSFSESGFGSTATGGTSFGGHFAWSDGNIYWDFGGQSSPNRVTIAGADWTRDSVFVFTAGKTGSYVYQNGALLGSNSTAITRTPGSSTFGLTYGNSATNVDEHVDTLVIVAERQWTPREVAELTDNPFRAAEIGRSRRLIYFGALPGGSPQTLALTPVTETETAVALAFTPGAVSVALSPVVETETAQPLSFTPGAVSVALSPVVETETAQPLSFTPGAVSVALSPVIETETAQPLSFTPGAVSVALSPVIETETAVALAFVTYGADTEPVRLTYRDVPNRLIWRDPSGRLTMKD